MMLILSITIIGGTFAWFTYRSRESALVLSIGDINDSKVIIEPYQIREELIPTNSYTGGVYSQITAINNNSNNLIMNLFYKINQIDELLINNGLKYTIVSSDSKDGEYKELDTGDFINIKNNKIKIINTSIESNTTTYYRVYLWLDTNAGNQVVIQNSVLDVELNGDINQVANRPILDEGMVPVVIYEDGTVMTTTEHDLEWYNYENQQWANIVLVNENATNGVEGSQSREYYLNNPDTEVIESDILGYYVWIPRYKYKIWTTGVSAAGQEQEIEIMFESFKEPMKLGTNVGEFRTHPAFWWDNDNDSEYDEGEMLPGIWVGKFETTGSATSPTVKPNTASLVNQTISAQFSTSLKFAGGSMNSSTGEVAFGDNTYGLTEITDSHMMKNSEWGAVAYLSHSTYGINKEVRINNYYASSKTLTGCGATSANAAESTTCGIPYGSPSTENNTYPQSTTGNITGVFDMSGGAWDTVMGNYNKTKSNSGFSIFPEKKYYDNYTTLDVSTACNGGLCYGHSLTETNRWYGDVNNFLTTSDVWIYRGSRYNGTTETGIFNYSVSTGLSTSFYSHHSVLIPNMNYTVNFDANDGSFVDISYTTVGEHEFVIPADGKYQLEVWGAQGGNHSNTIIGGKGGYSVGTIKLTSGTNLFVNVGGVGIINSGGYNGGGNGGSGSGNGGGGATHIATLSGELSSLYDNKSSLLIVAGGGGGADTWSSGAAGGSGGGSVGVAGTWTGSSSMTWALGGTQLAGGVCQTSGATYNSGSGSFGQGGVGATWGGGGGGGYYGGSGGNAASDWVAGGGGGSGYIGNSLLTSKYMYCYNCSTSVEEHIKTYTTTNVSADAISNYAKSGNGAARIRQISEKDITYGYKYGNMPTPTKDGYVFAGWYTEPENGTKVTDDTIVDKFGDITLYARWSPLNMNITYSVNGGTINSSTTSADGNTIYNWNTIDDMIYLNEELYISNLSGSETINLPNYNDSNFMNIAKDGYIVLENEEWICLSGCKKDYITFSQNKEYQINDFCDTLQTECNIILGINFLEGYLITYDANGGSEPPLPQNKVHGVNTNLSTSIPIKIGYTFLGWSTDSEDTSATYSAGSEYTPNANVTLYAIWRVFNILTSYSCANGSVGNAPYDITYTGDCTVIDDGDGNWRVKFLTTGTFTSINNANIDIFLVGGGGGGNYSGGGGGYTKTVKNVDISGNTNYTITIGAGGNNAAGGKTSAFDFAANGGARGENTYAGSGGSGGGGYGGDTANAGNGGYNNRT